MCVLLHFGPARLNGQAITVVANRAFHPTAVLLPHAQYWLGTDSADGALVLRDVTINPVTIGTIRVEGIEPLERQAEPRPYPDTVHFQPDGRVTFALSNGNARPPLTAEVIGSRQAPALRLTIAARSWPLTRVMLVTIAPADLREARWRSVGWGERDRIRIDDAAKVAYLSDSTTGPTTVAVAIGNARGRLQADAADAMVTRDVGGATVQERRHVAALTLIIEPARTATSEASVDILVGMGNSEAEALQSARLAGGETPPAYPRSPLHVTTPAADVSLLLDHVLGAARPMLDYDRIVGLRHTPAGSADMYSARAREGWYGAMTALQVGDAGVVCSEYQLMKRYAEANGAQREEVANRLGPRGRIAWTDGRGAASMSDKEPSQLLKAWACYRATRDATWLAAELPNLRRIAAFMVASDADADGLLESASDGTFSAMSPLAPDSTVRVEDPYVNALSAWALERLAELEDAAGPGSVEAGADRQAAARIRAALSGLWRPERRWFAYQTLPDGSRSWDHPHIQEAAVAILGGADSAEGAAMATRLAEPGWWDESARAFASVPLDDSWYDGASQWRGLGWHGMDFIAFEAMLLYGNAGQRRVAWERLSAEATRVVRGNYGRPGERADVNGLSMFSAGAYLDLLGRGLFGIEEHLDRIEIAPHLDGIADDQLWRIDGWTLGTDTLSVAYRPADRRLTVRLGALQRRRVVFRLPWITAGSCITARRGSDTEPLAPVSLSDGGVYVDVRAAYDPAELTVSAGACGR